MDAGLEQLKVISREEDGGREWVPISGGQRNKRVGESAGSIFIQFDSGGVLAFENRVFLIKTALGGIIDFSSPEQTPWYRERAEMVLRWARESSELIRAPGVTY